MATTGQSRKTSLVWKISGFSLCDRQTGRYLRSPEFGPSGETFLLRLYPRGERDGYADYLSLFLLSKSNAVVSSVAVTASIQTVLGSEKHFADKCFSTRGKGWRQFIKRESLLGPDSNKQCLPEDVLQLRCVVEVLTTCSSQTQHHEKNQLTRDFGQFLARKTFTDVILEAEDTKFHVHKVVLASRSSVFESLLKKDTVIVNVADVGKDVLRCVLYFLYTDVCSFEDDEYLAMEVLKAAHKFDIPLLKIQCDMFLYARMCNGNVVDIMIAATSVGELDLYKKCLDYICHEMPSLTFLPDFKQKLLTHPAIFSEIVERFA